MSDKIFRNAISHRLDVFRAEIRLFIDQKEMNDSLHEMGLRTYTASCGGVTSAPIEHLGKTYYVVGLFEDDDAVLVHELSHVVFAIFERLGMDPRPSYGESFCYTLDHLFTLFKEAIKERKQSIAKEKMEAKAKAKAKAKKSAAKAKKPTAKAK